MINSLERRQLLSTAAIVDRTLQIEGTAGADAVEVALFENNQAQVFDGQSVLLTFNIADVDRVRFVGGTGDDVCILGRTPFSLEFDGGAGDDAGSASQRVISDPTLVGGEGNDYLYGGGGDDTLNGGLGYDRMIGGTGSDYFRVYSDNNGDDTIGGDGTGRDDPGIDTLDASDYNEFGTGFGSETAGVVYVIGLQVGDTPPEDVIISDYILDDVDVLYATVLDDNVSNISGGRLTVSLGAGNDRYTGGRAGEVVNGGAGLDSLSGSGGDDTLITRGTGIDEISGGSGTDLLLLDRPAGNDNISGVEEVRNVTTAG